MTPTCATLSALMSELVEADAAHQWETCRATEIEIAQHRASCEVCRDAARKEDEE